MTGEHVSDSNGWAELLSDIGAQDVRRRGEGPPRPVTGDRRPLVAVPVLRVHHLHLSH